MEYVARGPTGLFGWALARSPDGRAAVCLGWFGGKGCDPERSSLVQGTSSLAAGQWHHLAITRAADTFALYVNGRADGTGRVRGGFSELIDMWVRLGSDEAGAAALRGLIDEIEIYNRALTPEEIQSRGK